MLALVLAASVGADPAPRYAVENRCPPPAFAFATPAPAPVTATATVCVSGVCRPVSTGVVGAPAPVAATVAVAGASATGGCRAGLFGRVRGRWVCR